MEYSVTIDGVDLLIRVGEEDYISGTSWPSGDPKWATGTYIQAVEVGGVDITTLLSEDVADQIIKAIKSQYGVEVEF